MIIESFAPTIDPVHWTLHRCPSVCEEILGTCGLAGRWAGIWGLKRSAANAPAFEVRFAELRRR